MKLKTLVFTVVSLSVFASVHPQSKQRPNIVIIMADDLGYGDFSCYGAKKYSTPAVDAVAASGMRFTDAHTASSLCTPSRYSMMTGRYSWRTRLRSGVLTWFGQPMIEPTRTTIASMLQRNGYYTAAIGKWHLGFDWALKPNAPADPVKDVFNSWEVSTQDHIDFSKPAKEGPITRGFDYYYGISASNNMIPFVFIDNDRVTQPPVIKKDYVFDTDQKSTRAANWDLETIDAELTKKAVAVIDNHFAAKTGQPLFLYYPTSAIHRPCLPKNTKNKSGAGFRGDMVLEFDWIVKQVVDALKRNNAYDNTLFIITSDNGAQPGDPVIKMEQYKSDLGEFYYPSDAVNYQPQYIHPAGNAIGKRGWITYDHASAGSYRGFKSDAWEGGHRVPLIMRWPGTIKAGQTVSNLVCNVDMLATLSELVGDHLSAGEGEDSHSYLGNITGRSKSQVRKSLTIVAGSTGAYIVRIGNWKYIEPGKATVAQTYYEEVRPDHAQLYDLGKDPGEKNNLYTKMPAKVAEFKKLIEEVEKQARNEAAK